MTRSARTARSPTRETLREGGRVPAPVITLRRNAPSFRAMRGAMRQQRIFHAPNGRSATGPLPDRAAAVEPRAASLAFVPRDASRALMARLLGRVRRAN